MKFLNIKYIINFTFALSFLPVGYAEAREFVKIIREDGLMFEIGSTEVTQAEWEEVMNVNPSLIRDPKFPVSNITWHEAMEYIRRLPKKDRCNYNLPSEDQWRAAAILPGKVIQPSQLEEYGWFSDNAGSYIQPVSTIKPTLRDFEGKYLFDIYGNVWEWTKDCNGIFCKIMGGSAITSVRGYRGDMRASWNTDMRANYVGFRLVRVCY